MTNDYWWGQRLSDATFEHGRVDAKRGLPPALPSNFDYMAGYNTFKLLERKP